MHCERKLKELNFSREQQDQCLAALGRVCHADRRRFETGLARLGRGTQDLEIKKQELMVALSEALVRAEERGSRKIDISYDGALPITQKKDEIIKAIREHQVLVLAGETGSGKTTQLPKMCLEAGLGVRGMIGHTQPRRIAARSVAARIASELGEEVGSTVGYKVRFNDSSSPGCLVKLMTDGILLSEIAHDRQLLNYECIIIDEAHERSLNIDFLLGYLTTLLKKRPELKLIVTSATIDHRRFSEHFGNCPVIEVEGRTYPVEVAYMPLVQEKDEEGGTVVREVDLHQGILQAVKMLMEIERADVLVFLPGEREIAETMAFLNRQHLPGIEVLPLYARLAYSEQSRIFREHSGVRVILSTNVAETSITVPSIRYVIDVGLARISRYSPRTKIQHLPVEPVSRSSADQRKGRCGRVAPGICVRLYDEADYLNRPEYTDPEIRRSNLGSVILQMIYLRLGDIKGFPFIDRPEDKQINDGLRMLYEIGAVKSYRNREASQVELTPTGTEIARLPIDPRLGRMIVEGARNACLNEVLIICSALAISDPRESPFDRREAAAQAHARFRDEKSDFSAILKLYAWLQERQGALSKRQFISELKKSFISYLRTKEWFDLHLQLRLICKSQGYRFNQVGGDYASLHRSLVSGLLANLGAQTSTPGEYQGANGIKFLIFPGSFLFRQKPKFIMANEISETSRLYARTVASIDPQWAVHYAQHLVKRTYTDVYFSKTKGCACAYMTVTLYSLPLITRQSCLYNRIDPKISRELFIKEGLVHGNLNCRHKFFLKNRELMDEVHDLEDRVRSKDLLADENVLYDFYAGKIPEDVTCLADFDKWYRQKAKEDDSFLEFSFEGITKDKARDIKKERYPDYFEMGDMKLRLSYVFDPGDERDGVSVHIPVTLVNQVKSEPFLYLVPSLQDELFTALIKSLPKRLRRNLIPAPDYARALKERLEGTKGNLFVNAARELTKIGGEQVSPDDFDLSLIDRHLFMTFVIEDLDGSELASGKKFEVLADSLRGRVGKALAEAATRDRKAPERQYTAWEFGDIPERQSAQQGSVKVVVYPAISDHARYVTLEYCQSALQQRRTMALGERRLILLSVPKPTAYLNEHLPNRAKLAMYYKKLGTIESLIDDLCLCAIDELVEKNGGYTFKEARFLELCGIVRGGINDTVLDLALTVEKSLTRAHELQARLSGNFPLNLALLYKDTKANLDRLIHKGFIADTGPRHLRDMERYLEAMLFRMERAPLDVPRDLGYQRKLDALGETYQNALSRYRGSVPGELADVGWSIQELRVSYFAQKLGVKEQVSDKRIAGRIEQILTDSPPNY